MPNGLLMLLASFVVGVAAVGRNNWLAHYTFSLAAQYGGKIAARFHIGALVGFSGWAFCGIILSYFILSNWFLGNIWWFFGGLILFGHGIKDAVRSFGGMRYISFEDNIKFFAMEAGIRMGFNKPSVMVLWTSIGVIIHQLFPNADVLHHMIFFIGCMMWALIWSFLMALFGIEAKRAKTVKYVRSIFFLNGFILCFAGSYSVITFVTWVLAVRSL